MDAGKLDRRIDICTKAPVQNDYGEITYVDELLASVSAQVVPIGGRETFIASQVVPQAQLKVVIRHRNDVTTRHNVRFDGKTYDILHVAEVGRRDALELLVKLP